MLLAWLSGRCTLTQASAAGLAIAGEVNRVPYPIRFVQTQAEGEEYRGSRRVFEANYLSTPAAQRWLRRHCQPAADPC